MSAWLLKETEHIYLVHNGYLAIGTFEYNKVTKHWTYFSVLGGIKATRRSINELMNFYTIHNRKEINHERLAREVKDRQTIVK